MRSHDLNRLLDEPGSNHNRITCTENIFYCSSLHDVGHNCIEMPGGFEMQTTLAIDDDVFFAGKDLAAVARQSVGRPLTENGVLRIVGHSRNPNSPGNPAAVAHLMAGLRSLSGHIFWSDDVSLHDTEIVEQTQLNSSGQLTDTYLLALDCAHGGQLVTFDARLVTSAVRHG